MKIRNSLSLLALSGTLLTALPASAGEFVLRASDDTVHINVSDPMESKEISFGLGYLYKNGEGEKNKANIINADLHAVGRTKLGTMPTVASIGLQANYAHQDFTNYRSIYAAAVGVGGMVAIALPDVPGLSLDMQAHYAPDILAWDDSDAFRRALIELNYSVIKNADIITGYRYINTGLKNTKSFTFESGVYVGFRALF